MRVLNRANKILLHVVGVAVRISHLPLLWVMHIGFPALRHGDSVGQNLVFTAGSLYTFSEADSRSGLMYEFFWALPASCTTRSCWVEI